MKGEHPWSTFQIGGHPIHPMLVQFPIVCFILTFVCDIFYTRSHTELAGASNWLLGIGLVLLYSGWRGGALVYRQGVGVRDNHSP